MPLDTRDQDKAVTDFGAGDYGYAIERADCTEG